MHQLHEENQLDDIQNLFFLEERPSEELYGLKADPFEINNLANNPEYAEIKAELLQELNNWRENVIKDKGVSEEFRAGGWPSTYPTRTLEEWEHVLELWQPWVFREPGSKVQRPDREITKGNLAQITTQQ